MYYRRIILWLVLSACLAGCNAPSDDDAMRFPVNDRIVNAQLVTLEVISVNGVGIPPESLKKAVATFRQYVSGDVRVEMGKPVTVKTDQKGRISNKQIRDIIRHRRFRGPSDITILLVLRQIETGARELAYYKYDFTGAQYIVYQTKAVQQDKPIVFLSDEDWHRLVLLHELCHSLGIPCNPKRCWAGHHCTHPDCILYPTLDNRSYGTALLRHKLPTCLCKDCLAEVHQAQLAAHGKRIPPDAPYDHVSFLDEMIRLNPDKPNLYIKRSLHRMFQKQYTLALEDQNRAIELKPLIFHYMIRSICYRLMEDFPAAEQDLETVLKKMKKDKKAINHFAWVLATAPAGEYRHGKMAVKAAKKVCRLDKWKHAEYITTLAAAYAEQGKFDMAVAYQTMAIDKDRKKKHEKEFQERLELYRQKKPYRTPSSGDEKNPS